MKPNARLLCGPLSAIVFLIGTICVALFLPGYSHVRQAVSEIGALGTPTRIPFAVVVCLIGLCVLAFATALRTIAKRYAVSVIPAYLTAFVALTEIGIGIFAIPHPLHGPIGLSAILGFQAPGVLAVSWRRNVKLQPLIGPSWWFFIGLWCATGLILGPNFWPGVEALMEPVGGLIQRTLFVAWFGWCAVIGLLLVQIEREPSGTLTGA